MKKYYISREEADEGISLFCNIHTFKTLLTIDRYQMDANRIQICLDEVLNRERLFWSKLMNKYNIPLYPEKNMYIDNEDSAVCIEE